MCFSGELCEVEEKCENESEWRVAGYLISIVMVKMKRILVAMVTVVRMT